MNKFNILKSSNFLSSFCLFWLFFGFLVRFRQYFYNRSLWFDEVALALNIVNRSYTQLLDTLKYNQAAPPLFLWIEKLSIQVFGNNEYALRLFPFLCGVISLFLFYLLAIRFTSGITTVIAIALFASLKEIVYYTTELKQYSSDLTIGLLLFLCLTSVHSKKLNIKQTISLSILGAFSIWLSHPSIFIMAGVEITNLVGNCWQKIKNILVNRIFLYTFWLINFALLYVLTIQKTMSNESLVDSWGVRYPSSVLDIVWLLDAFGRFFYKPMGFIGIGDGIGLIVFTIGAIVLSKTNKFKLLILNAPLLITLIAAYLQKYPFRDRLILFLSPYAILVISEGISFLVRQCYRKYQQYEEVTNKNKSLIALAANSAFTSLIVISLTVLPIARSSLMIVKPSWFNIEHIRLGMEYIKSNQQPGDIFYIFPTTQLQFKYYAQRYNLSPEDYINATYNPTDSDDKYRQEIAQIKHKGRIWFVLSLSRFQAEKFPQQIELLSTYLNEVAEQVEVIQEKDYFMGLYDFTPQNNIPINSSIVISAASTSLITAKTLSLEQS